MKATIQFHMTMHMNKPTVENHENDSSDTVLDSSENFQINKKTSAENAEIETFAKFSKLLPSLSQIRNIDKTSIHMNKSTVESFENDSSDTVLGSSESFQSKNYNIEPEIRTHTNKKRFECTKCKVYRVKMAGFAFLFFLKIRQILSPSNVWVVRRRRYSHFIFWFVPQTFLLFFEKMRQNNPLIF